MLRLLDERAGHKQSHRNKTYSDANMQRGGENEANCHYDYKKMQAQPVCIQDLSEKYNISRDRFGMNDCPMTKRSAGSEVRRCPQTTRTSGVDHRHNDGTPPVAWCSFLHSATGSGVLPSRAQAQT